MYVYVVLSKVRKYFRKYESTFVRKYFRNIRRYCNMIHVFIRPLSGRERSRCLRHVAVRVNARRAQPRRTSTIDEDARARGAGEHAARVFRVRGGARARERRTRRSRVARYVALDRRTSRERDGVRGELAGQRAELREPRIRDANHVVRARESAGSRRGGVEQAARAVHGRERCAACPRWIALAAAATRTTP